MICIAVPPRPRHGDLAQLTGIQIETLDFQIVLAEALLHADLADAVVDASRLHDGRAFVDGQRQRLFHVDVFAGVQRVDGAAGVPVIGSRDQHRIDVFRVQQLAMIVEAFGRRGFLPHLVDLGAVDIANGVYRGFLTFPPSRFAAKRTIDLWTSALEYALILVLRTDPEPRKGVLFADS